MIRPHPKSLLMSVGVTTPGTRSGQMPPRRDADVHLWEDTCARGVRSSTWRDSEVEIHDAEPSLWLTPWKPLVCGPQLLLLPRPHGEGQASHIPLPIGTTTRGRFQDHAMIPRKPSSAFPILLGVCGCGRHYISLSTSVLCFFLLLQLAALLPKVE